MKGSIVVDEPTRSTDVGEFLALLHEQPSVFEVRIPHCPSKRGGTFKRTASGYFNQHEIAAMRVAEFAAFEPPAIYVTINPVVSDLLARANNRIEFDAKSTTNDEGVVRRRWLLVDIDPSRFSNVSATAGEMQAALDLGRDILAALTQLGWPAPLYAMSGNGCYLLYRIDLPNDEDARKLVEQVLTALGKRFDTPAVTVDTTTSNASRICAIFGTVKRKGDHLVGVEGIKDRPHRLAWFERPAGPLQVVPRVLLEAIAAECDVQEQPKPQGNLVVADESGTNTGEKKQRSSPMQRCIKYLTKMKDSISGDYGHKHLFNAARKAWEFFTTEAEVIQALKWFNSNKTGSEEWSDEDLKRKAEEGRKAATAKGRIGIRLKDRLRCDLPTIKTGPDEMRVTDETIAAISKREGIYQRGGVLVEVRESPKPPVCIERPEGGLRAVQLPKPRLREIIADSAVFERLKIVDGAEVWETCRVPATAVDQTEARGNWPEMASLEGIVQSPQFLADGTVLDTPGYDRRSGLYFAGDIKFMRVPREPTIDDAIRARDELLEVIVDFPCDDLSRSAWLATVLTGSARHAIAGPIPLPAIDANTRGTGKSLAADAIGIIHTGRLLPRTSAPRDDDEMRKRITAILLAGDPHVLFDNVNHPLGGAALDALLTSTTWTDRILGETQMTLALPNRAIWMATGNNMQFEADTGRRVLRMRLETALEKPEKRSGFVHDNLLAWVRQERARLAAAVVVILRAWHVAGRPNMHLPAWGSFESWSDIVRNAVAWVGMPDPGETRLDVQKESDRDAQLLNNLLNAWEDADPDGHGLTVVEAIKLAKEGHDGLSATFSGLLDRNGNMSAQKIGMRIHHLKGRICGGRCFDKRDVRKGALWLVKSCTTNTTSATKTGSLAREVEEVENIAHRGFSGAGGASGADEQPEQGKVEQDCLALHLQPENWRNDAGRLVCPKCGRFMGRASAAFGSEAFA